MFSIRSTLRRVASPPSRWTSWLSHWKCSRLSGLKGRMYTDFFNATAPSARSFRQTRTRKLDGWGGTLTMSTSQAVIGVSRGRRASIRKISLASLRGSCRSASGGVEAYDFVGESIDEGLGCAEVHRTGEDHADHTDAGAVGARSRAARR